MRYNFNKKAQFETKLLAVVLIFIIGIILFFFNHVNDQLYTSLGEYFNTTEDFNESEAQTALTKIHFVENSVWDFAFLAIFIGLIMQIVLFSFATRINIAFFWVLVLMDLPILIVGVILSNVWQGMSTNAEFTDTIARFPITDIILGSYYPIVVVFIIFISSIILFGKRPTEQ